MDISQLAVPDTATIHLEFPGVGKLYSDKEKKKPTCIVVYGPATDEAVKQRRKASQAARSLFAKKGAKAIAQKSAEDVEEDEVQSLVALTSGVKNLEYKGEKVTVENIDRVYRDPKMGWLVEQVKERLAGWESFLA